MKRWMLLGFALLVLVMGLPAVFGNMSPIPFLDYKPIQEVKLTVKVDDKATIARLQVPYSFFLSQSAYPPSLPSKHVDVAGTPKFDDDAGTPKHGDKGGRLALPTIIAGVALALAFACGGLWLLRRRADRALAILLMVGVFAAGTAALWTDLLPGRSGRRLRPSAPATKADFPARKLSAGIELPDKLILEIITDGDQVTLIVPKSMISAKQKKHGE